MRCNHASTFTLQLYCTQLYQKAQRPWVYMIVIFLFICFRCKLSSSKVHPLSSNVPRWTSCTSNWCSIDLMNKRKGTHNNQPSTHGVVPFVVPSFNWWHCGQGNIILICMQQSTPCTNNWRSINLMNKLQEIHTTINHLNATALIDGIMGKITKF